MAARPWPAFSRTSVTLGVDIHPAARIGSGLMLDHATGIVVGEPAVIDDDVSILHAVTLGGSELGAMDGSTEAAQFN